ncbi:hypothetical protein C9374_009805 [Naegleria lovaniensis]|uniref:Palmitoyltransferase n=1 Tax=Naegleria lovaniensis TaxID=51637 RepID=A0AA88GY71_NAELO|nr:uncharacterized protein C9374_009805 [Naegleria lovaniensis]KAG2393228.1 hypothetical protein C9374_009805 [Naegleria lovaniensis]
MLQFSIDKSLLNTNQTIPLGGFSTLTITNTSSTSNNTFVPSSSINSDPSMTITNHHENTQSSSSSVPCKNDGTCSHHHHHRSPSPTLHRKSSQDACCSNCVKVCQNSLLPGVVVALSCGAYLVGALFIVPFAFPLFHPERSTSMMWFLHFLNQIWGLFELCMLLWSYFRCMKTSPGVVSTNWQDSFSEEEVKTLLALEPQKHGEPRYCSKTGMNIPPRAHFSSVQKKVILRMDHYCIWVNNCVGLYNHKYFYLFLTYLVMAVTHFFFVTIFVVLAFIKDSSNIDVTVFLLTLVFNVFLVPMSCMIYLFWGWNTYLLLLNQTSIENFQLSEKRARSQMKNLNPEHLKYLNFYNVSYLTNIKQVLGQNVWKWFLPIPDDLGTDGYRYPTILPYEKIIEMQKETFTHVLPDSRELARSSRGPHSKAHHSSRYSSTRDDDDDDSSEYGTDDELV